MSQLERDQDIYINMWIKREDKVFLKHFLQYIFQRHNTNMYYKPDYISLPYKKKTNIEIKPINRRWRINLCPLIWQVVLSMGASTWMGQSSPWTPTPVWPASVTILWWPVSRRSVSPFVIIRCLCLASAALYVQVSHISLHITSYNGLINVCWIQIFMVFIVEVIHKM